MRVMRELLCAVLALAGVGAAFAWDYDVGRPSASLRPKWFAADTEPGVWTLNQKDALAKAKAAGRPALLMFTGSWWCPYCKTLEEMVFKSQAWRDYVAEKGFYLAMQDFPYRNAVPAGQEDKGTSPLGAGWGFKCWLYDSDYLDEIGLTAEEGLREIERMYVFQNEMAQPSATRSVISNWNGTATLEVGKVGYPTLVVIDSTGVEAGRVSFPWHQPGDVTASEAQEYVIQGIERLLNGDCCICENPFCEKPETSRAQVYRGWLEDGDLAIAGTVEVKVSKAQRDGRVKVSGFVQCNGRKTTFAPVVTDVTEEEGISCTLVRKGSEERIDLAMGSIGLVGTYFDGTRELAVTGGRDMFKAKDATAQALVGACPSGIWSVVLQPVVSADTPTSVRGFGALTVAFKRNGQVGVTGTLGDGSKVSVSAKALVGKNGAACVPVYRGSKDGKSDFGFVVWFRAGRLNCFRSVMPWKVRVGGRAFEVALNPASTMASGVGVLREELEYTLLDFDPAGTQLGLPLVEDPTFDIVAVSKNGWNGLGMTGFKATMKSSGLMSGSVKFLLEGVNGRQKTVRGAFTGVVMGGSAYGTVVVRQAGAWPAKIAVCGSCGE